MTEFAALYQEIRANFRYGVYFTEDVFGLHNPLLSEIVARGGGDLPVMLRHEKYWPARWHRQSK